MGERMSGQEQSNPVACGDLCVAAAQCISAPGDLSSNLAAHAAFIAQAAAAGVDVLVFPELSLCGYELHRLRDWAPALSLASLSALAELARAHDMSVVAGAPHLGESGQQAHIASVVFPRQGAPWVYAKRHLHPGEELHVSPGDVQPGILQWGPDACALAICAEITQPWHAQAAADAGASAYLASVLVSAAGYAVDAGHLQQRAIRHRFGVLMANHGGPPGNYDSAGRSAFWSPDGRLLAVAPAAGNYLVVANRIGRDWTARVVAVPA
jgi:predicted amidohydrolase